MPWQPHSAPAVAPSLPKPSLKPETRETHFPGILRPLRPPILRSGLIELHYPHVPVQGDVSHHARKLSVQYTCLGKIKERIQLSQSRDVHILSSPISFPILPDIYLQEIRIEDAAAIYHAIDTHRDYLRTWLPFVDNMRTTADEEAFYVRYYLLLPNEMSQYSVFGTNNMKSAD